MCLWIGLFYDCWYPSFGCFFGSKLSFSFSCFWLFLSGRRLAFVVPKVCISIKLSGLFTTSPCVDEPGRFIFVANPPPCADSVHADLHSQFLTFCLPDALRRHNLHRILAPASFPALPPGARAGHLRLLKSFYLIINAIFDIFYEMILAGGWLL